MQPIRIDEQSVAGRNVDDRAVDELLPRPGERMYELQVAMPVTGHAEVEAGERIIACIQRQIRLIVVDAFGKIREYRQRL